MPVMPDLPKRLQRKRVKGYRLPEGARCVTRPGKFGNPFVVGQNIPFLPGRKVQDGRHAASLYHGSAPQNALLCEAIRAELKGADLACYCRLCDLHQAGKPMGIRCPDCAPCHVDTMLEIANG